jgi:hypothetical protein
MDKIDILSSSVAKKLKDIFEFERWEYGGKLPSYLKNDNLVLGFHFGLANKIFEAHNCYKENQDDFDTVVIKSISLALEITEDEVRGKFLNLIRNKNEEFRSGNVMALKAWPSILSSNPLSLMEFKMALRKKEDDL